MRVEKFGLDKGLVQGLVLRKNGLDKGSLMMCYTVVDATSSGEDVSFPEIEFEALSSL